MLPLLNLGSLAARKVLFNFRMFMMVSLPLSQRRRNFFLHILVHLVHLLNLLHLLQDVQDGVPASVTEEEKLLVAHLCQV